MTDEIQTLTAQIQANGIYRVAYDGHFRGDDRGYSTLAACETEIDQRIAIDQRDAVKYDRPVMYRKG
jgi:hypothetical protein